HTAWSGSRRTATDGRTSAHHDARPTCDRCGPADVSGCPAPTDVSWTRIGFRCRRSVPGAYFGKRITDKPLEEVPCPSTPGGRLEPDPGSAPSPEANRVLGSRPDGECIARGADWGERRVDDDHTSLPGDRP